MSLGPGDRKSQRLASLFRRSCVRPYSQIETWPEASFSSPAQNGIFPGKPLPCAEPGQAGSPLFVKAVRSHWRCPFGSKVLQSGYELVTSSSSMTQVQCKSPSVSSICSPSVTRRPTVDWSRLDWRLPNSEIARMTGASLGYVSALRKKLKKPRSPYWNRKPQYRDWAQVDWTQKDRALADSLGVSRAAVWAMRKKLGVPPAPNPKRPRSTELKLARVKAEAKVFKYLTVSETDEVLGHGCDRASPVFRAVKEIARPSRKHPWEEMNFDLPSRTLDSVWKLPYNMAASYRLRTRLPPPKWNLRFVKLKAFRDSKECQQFHEGLEAEQRKAKQFYQSVANARRAKSRWMKCGSWKHDK